MSHEWENFYRFLTIVFGPTSPVTWLIGVWLVYSVGKHVYVEYIAEPPDKFKLMSRKELEQAAVTCMETNAIIGDRNRRLNEFIRDVCKMTPP